MNSILFLILFFKKMNVVNELPVWTSTTWSIANEHLNSNFVINILIAYVSKTENTEGKQIVSIIDL